MVSIRAIYDGKHLKLKEKISVNSPREVIVTFLDEPEEDITTEIQQLVAEGGAFDFLDSPQEDIYSDKDLKVKYE